MSLRLSNHILVGCVLLVAAVMTACSGKNGAAPSGPPPAEVGVVVLASQPATLTRELSGRTSPYLVAEVRPQVTGIVQQRLFTEGGLVKAGQALYQLDDAIYRADATSARAGLARAEAALTMARLRAKRSEELLVTKAVSQQDYDGVVAALQQAEADVAAAKAAAGRAAVVLAYARISSPIAGRIGKSSVTPGALVTANQADALATVQQLDPIYVDVTQSSSELLGLRQQLAAGRLEAANDLPVEILLEDGSRYEHAGKLAFSEVTVDPGTGSYTLRIVVPNPEHVLLPGIYVRAIIGTGVRPDAILAPQRGILHGPKGETTAMVLGADGNVAMRAVRVSQTIGDQWLVEEGLAAGDRVIVDGLQKIQPGMPARVAEPPPAEAPTAAAQR